MHGGMRRHAAYGLAIATPKVWDKWLIIRDLPIAPVVNIVVWSLAAKALARLTR